MHARLHFSDLSGDFKCDSAHFTTKKMQKEIDSGRTRARTGDSGKFFAERDSDM